jgi:DnaJ-class molecular chaperone
VRSPGPDLYLILGVSPAATTAELRRAYRRLALDHHPDRAGSASAAKFAQIAEAYRMLSNPTARAAYDAHLTAQRAHPASEADLGGGFGWSVSRVGWGASWARRVTDLLPRLTGPLATLSATGAARLAPDGVLELALTPHEAASGGTAIVTLPLRVPCPTCGGVATPRGVWCRRCEYAGQVDDAVAVRIAIPRAAPDGFACPATIPVSGAPPRVRIRITA